MPAAPPLSARKRRLFWAATLLLPLVFFVLLEGGLRLAGYGSSYPLFVPVEGYPGYLMPAPDVGRRYFAREQAVPNVPFNAFRAQKPTDGLRVVVQGASSAAGFPFYYGASLTDLLAQQLEAAYPDRPVEVINTAMAAVSSYALLDLCGEIIAQRPDAVVIYAGHNEYYGALGVGSAESLGLFRPLIRGYLKLQRLRTVQLLRAGLVAGAGLFAPEGPPGATLMERMVGEQAIPYGSPLYTLGLRQYERNLTALLARYQAAGIPVFIGTLASNEADQPPFLSRPAAEAAAWQAAYDAALTLAARGDTAAALQALERLAAQDTVAAAPHYARGTLLRAQRRPAEARPAFLAAKDRDQLRFRAPEAMNAVLRRLAARYGATVVETQAALVAASPEGLIGRRLMLEHLHPTVEGYAVLGRAFYEALRSGGVPALATAPTAPDTLRPSYFTPLDSLAGVYRVRQLLGSWPFQPPGTFDRSLDTLQVRTPVEAAALAFFRGETTWLEAANRLQQHYAATGDAGGQLRMLLAISRHYPFLPEAALAAGDLLVQQARYDEALRLYHQSNAARESGAARRMMGSVLLQLGRPGEAVAHLERAVALDGRDVQALYNLSGAYALQGDYARARATAERLLQQQPDHEPTRRLLASLPPA